MLDRLAVWLDHVGRIGRWLALPVSILLFAQWPLRHVPGGRPLLANDVAQALFALYVALAVRETTRRDAHLKAGARSAGGEGRVRLARIAAAVVLLPWSVMLGWTAFPMVMQSLRQFESYPESYNPGYWVVKLALGVLIGSVGLQALIDACGGGRTPPAD